MDMNKTRLLLRLNEGVKKHAYDDADGMFSRARKGNLTIGVGRNIDLAGGGPGLRDSEIDFMLDNDIDEHVAYVSRLVPTFTILSDVRQAVLVDMCHNMGIDDLADFRRMLKYLALCDWDMVAIEMRDSLWWDQVGLRGVRLVEMMLKDEWPKSIA